MLVVRVASGEESGETNARLLVAFGLVALFLEVDERLQAEVEEVGFRPYDAAVGWEVVVVFPVGSEFEGNFVFVEILLDVGAEAHEERELSRLELSGVVDKRFGVNPHLQTLVVAQVEHGVSVDGTCIARIEAGDLERHRLLVELGNLALARVDDTCDAGRQNIVDRFARGVFLDVDNRYVELSVGRSIAALVEIVVVATPFAAHEFEGSEAEVGDLTEARHEHTSEAYGREIVDRTDHLLIVAERDLELIPFHLVVLAISSTHHRHLFVGDIVASHFEVAGTNRNLVLEIAFILVERIVLVDVLDVGGVAGRLIERFVDIFGRERVAFDTIVTFIAVEDSEALSVIVVAAIEMVVVAGGVVER